MLPIHVLLVEDNPDDVELTRIAFAEAKIANPLHVVGNGVEALDYLFGRGAWADQARHEPPALVLLDACVRLLEYPHYTRPAE